MTQTPEEAAAIDWVKKHASDLDINCDLDAMCIDCEHIFWGSVKAYHAGAAWQREQSQWVSKVDSSNKATWPPRDRTVLTRHRGKYWQMRDYSPCINYSDDSFRNVLEVSATDGWVELPKDKP